MPARLLMSIGDTAGNVKKTFAGWCDATELITPRTQAAAAGGLSVCWTACEKD